MKKAIIYLALATSFMMYACNSEDHGNPPAGDMGPNSAPKDVDSMNTSKDTALFPR